MVTIKQIAEAAGVSATTVSNVIHGKTKKVSLEKLEIIQNLIEELGYVKPLGLSVLHNTRSHMIAVIINRHQIYEQSILNDPFYGIIIGHIEEELHKKGYYMIFYSADNVDEVFEMILKWNVDGVILISMGMRECEKISQMVKKPVVCIDPVENKVIQIRDKESEINGVSYICLNDEKGGYLMTRHLIDLGYETIYVCGPKINFGVDLQRTAGAQRALKESGKEDAVELITIASGISYLERVQFYKYLHKKIPFKKKTALFCTADRYALEAGSYLQERGVLLPQEMGLTGFDDISYIAQYSFPRLTTIRQNVFYKSQLAVEEIVRSIEEPEYQMMNHVLDVSLIVRESAIKLK